MRIKPNCMDRFLVQQQVWNESMARQSGFVNVTVGTEIEHQNWATIVVQFQTQNDLDQFMTTAHDQLEKSTRISDLIEELDVRLIQLRL